MANKKQSYENMMEDLETLVTEMEENTMSLDQSIENYEKGIKLCNKLYKKLLEAKQKITILKEDGEENFLEKEE